MSETTAECVRGCTMYRYHLAQCEGIDGETCLGCLPKRANKGRLCDTCARRLELMIHDAPTVIRWLTGNMTASDGASRMKEDYERRGGGSSGEKGLVEHPAPIVVGILDARDLLTDRLTLWVDDWCEHKGLAGPAIHTPELDAEYLLRWLPGLCALDWIGDWWQEMAETMSEAHALAPWRPAVRRLPGVPCPGCTETNLVIYGGETDICCGSCRIMMSEDRFELWQTVLRDERAAS